MASTEFVYIFVLLSSVGFGQMIKYAKGPVQKRLISTSVGVAMVVSLCGWQTYHSIICVVISALIIRCNPNRCHLYSFVFCFGYLPIFRLGHLLGLPQPTDFINVVQLLLTLRLVGVSFEVHDSRKARAMAEDEGLNHNQTDGKPPRPPTFVQDPSATDLFHYSFCYIGLFSGPYYTYKTYRDMLHCGHSHTIPSMGPILHRLKILLPMGAGYLALSQFPCSKAEYYLTEDFYAQGYFQRIGLTAVLATAYRLRMYAAWLLAECVCISSTLGAYPISTKPRVGQGPTVDPAQIQRSDEPVEYSFTTIQNIDWYLCEGASDFRGAIRYWNMTVQWWLKKYVYIRFPYKSWSMSVTFLVSGLWHGTDPGYLLCFLTTPLLLLAEGRARALFHRSGRAFSWRDAVGWLLKCLAFQYVHMGFRLLGFGATLRYWASTYFLGHALALAFLGVAALGRPPKIPEKVQ